MRQLERSSRKPHPLHYSHTQVHALFTKRGRRPPKLPILLDVVQQLVEMGPRSGSTPAELQAEIKESRVRFEKLWQAVVDSYDNPSTS